jgi:peptidoglycan-associated lipoprotein
MLRLLFFMLLLAAAACNYTIKIKDGATAYERKYYAQAAPMLEKDYANAKTRVEKGKKAYLIGDCYRNTGRYQEAIKWFQIAYENSFGPEALKAQAYMLKQTEQYADAQKAFKQLGQEIGSQYEYRREITACTVAEDWKKKSDATEWELTQANFNSPANDFSSTLSPDGRLVISSDRALSTGSKQYAWTKRPFSDLYIVDSEGASPQLLQNDVNTIAHEGTITFHPNGLEAWFSRSVPVNDQGGDHFMRLFHARKIDGAWKTADALPFQKDRINYTHPCLAPDGKTLYFSSNDGSWGGYDICFSTLEKEIWSEPKALPRAVNTGGNETFPVWNGDTLYFSSNEHTGMGGFDIFKTYRMGEKAWAPPINLKSPINSGFDDFGFLITKHNHKETAVGAAILEGFFTSNRPGGKGNDDIYRFTQRVPKPAPVPVKPDTMPIAKTGKIILEVVVLEKIFADQTNPNSAVVGRKPIAGANLEMYADAKLLKTQQLPDGTFIRELQPDQAFSFKASSEGFLVNTATVNTAGYSIANGQEQRIEVEIVLDKIYKNREIVLENIYYDYDRAEIRPDAEPTLAKLAETLVQNPQVKIQLGSHTDCRGNDRYNQELSQRRAQSAVNYLIAKGIEPGRLSAVGYGEASPVASCVCQACAENEHQMNRRTTFRIE